MDINNSESSKTPKLKEDEVLEPFLEYLEPACIKLRPGDELIIYRTQGEVPVDDFGQAPRPRRRQGDKAIKQKFTKEEVKSLPPQKRDRFIGESGLSCNDSEESARRSFLSTYKKLKEKGASEEDLKAFASERGIYICRYKFTGEHGLITPFNRNGHANLYLYEGVNLESLRDKEYNFKTIEYQTDED